MSKFRGTRSRFRGLRDLLDPGEVYPLFNFNFNFNSPSLVCSDPATSQPRVIYLFMPPFYYAFVSSACTRRLFSPPPSPPFELFDRWGVANGLLIFFFLAKKMFKLKKFRFVASTRWFSRRFDRVFCLFSCILFHDSRECDLKLWIWIQAKFFYVSMDRFIFYIHKILRICKSNYHCLSFFLSFSSLLD